MECSCCHNTYNEFSSGARCPICGFDDNNETLDKTGEEKVVSLANKYRNTAKYRKNMISNISSISIVATTYKYDENSNSFNQIGKIPVFKPELSGEECYGAVVKSDEWIAHFNEKAQLNVSYMFAGKNKTLQASVQPKECEGIWYLTLHINEELKLEIGLCVESVDGTTEISRQVLSTVPLDLCA